MPSGKVLYFQARLENPSSPMIIYFSYSFPLWGIENSSIYLPILSHCLLLSILLYLLIKCLIVDLLVFILRLVNCMWVDK